MIVLMISLSLSHYSLEGKERGRDERVRRWSPWTKRSWRERVSG